MRRHSGIGPLTIATLLLLLSVSHLAQAASPRPQTTAAVGNALSAPIYVNLYWGATWDTDNTTMPKAALDAFTAAILNSSYFGGLAEYRVGTPTSGGGFLPSPSCPQKSRSRIGFYDPFRASIMGFLNCELKNGGLPMGSQVVYNIILPSGSLESDFFIRGVETFCVWRLFSRNTWSVGAKSGSGDCWVGSESYRSEV